MRQHTIQKSWIKQFASSGEVRVTFKLDLSFTIEKPGKVGYIEDFQSEEAEAEDSTLESKVITQLYGLKKGRFKELSSIEELDKWTALHMARNPRDIESLRIQNVDFDRGRNHLIKESLKVVQSYPHLWVLIASGTEEPLILPDHPVTRLDSEALLMPLSPRTLIAYTCNDPNNYEFEGRSLFEAANEIFYAHAEKYIYSSPDKHPDFKELRARYEMRTRKDVIRTDVKIPR